MLASVKNSLKRLPGLRTLVDQRDGAAAEVAELRRQVAAAGFVPAGHFYSPIPDLDDVARDRDRIFDGDVRELPGIDLRDDAQFDLLASFVAYYDELPFTPEPSGGLRYHYENPAYSYCDGILLHCMIRHARPARIIEVGSGYSSCMILDTDERWFDGSIETTFVEPYPELLRSLLRDDDRARILPERLQDVDLDEFRRLAADDILFIDSTHVSKVGSDVNRLVFDILPILAPGVYVHVHDVHFPFEYPEVWIEEGRAWNEAYLLRAFLQFNSDFEVVLMSTYVTRFHRDFVAEHLPLCLRNPGGSLWLRRRTDP